MSKIGKHSLSDNISLAPHRTHMKKEIYMELFARRRTPLSDSRFSDTMNAETRNPLETSDCFACPFNEHQCHNHCLSTGYRGGFCGGFAAATCRCY